jgi:predicted nuclease of predicted toxin-antitoxin system
MVSLFGFPPKVVLIRRGNCSTKLILSLLEQHLDEIRLFISDNENGIFTIL